MPKNLENLNYWAYWVDTTPDVIFFKNLDGVYMGVSKSTAILAGLDSVDKMIGKTDFDIYPRECAEIFTNQDKKVIETGESSLVEDWIDHSVKGHILIETLKAPLYGENKEIIGVQGVSRDVTEKYNFQKIIKNQQAQMATMVNNIPFPIWLKDIEGRYVLVNKAYEDLFGLAQENIIGEMACDLACSNKFDTSIARRFEEEDKRIIEEKIVIHTSERATIHGKEYYFELTKSPVLGVNGEVIGVAGISVDVTIHKIYEDELEVAKDLAERANLAKGEFLANMSHEIRTPMNGIMGFMQLLSETELDEEQKDFVEEVTKSSELLLKLLNDILDLSKIEAGKIEMENISFSIRHAVEDVATLASSNAIRKNIEINALCYSGVPDKVFGDPSRLKQVLNNFVNNAIKFTDNGEIFVSAKVISKKNNRVRILFNIQDTGIGISKENQSKIFDSFTQADSSTTRKYGGTGLGLSISKNIIQMMKGEISLESEENIGSTFSFTAEFEIDKSYEETKVDREKMKGLKVLAVDDNRANLKIVDHYLKEFGVKTISATCVEDALTILRNKKHKIDIILTDYCMPTLNGIQLTHAVHKMDEYKNIPVVLLTSRAQRGDYRLVKENNLRGYLPKPIRKNELIECVSLLVSEEETGNYSNTIITRHSIKEKRMSEEVKILLVEDNSINQSLISKIINKAGYSCDLAQNGFDALTALEQSSYDMVFMDCLMPVMNGFEATAKIRQMEQEKKLRCTPIIALTAKVLPEDIKECEDAGMNDYLSKPINMELLVEKIKKYSSENMKAQESDFSYDEGDEISFSNDLLRSQIINFIVQDLGVDKSDAESLLGGFFKDLESAIIQINESVKNGDFESAFQIAHSMKGASGNLRVSSLFELLSQLEIEAKVQNTGNVLNLINQIKNEFSRLLN